MARNGSGTFSLPAGNPVVTGTTIQSTWANTTLSDLATAITQSVAADGQTPITANIPMGGFKITGLAAGSGAGDSVRYEQFASPPAIGGTAAAAGSFTTLAASSTVSGTGFSAYLASPPAIGGTAPAAGAFTTVSATGQITSTVTTGTAPMVIASTTEVANLRAATATSVSALTPNFTSSLQTVVVSSTVSYTIAHGLGAIPSLTTLSLVCVIADIGYSVNDEIQCPMIGPSSNTNTNVTADATNITLSQANTNVLASRKDTGALTGISSVANWRWKIRAWK